MSTNPDHCQSCRGYGVIKRNGESVECPGCQGTGWSREECAEERQNTTEISKSGAKWEPRDTPKYVRTDKQFLIAAMGFASTLLTSVLLSVIELKWEVALYSYMVWFVVPGGAFVAGMAAASGYFAGARIFHQKPAGGVLFNMIAASVSAFFLVHYIPYFLLEVEGVRVSQLISFWEYLDISIRATSYEFVRGRTSTGELGSAGYYIALIQLAGFALGGAAIFMFLKEIPYCEKCSRYLSETGSAVRYSAAGEGMAESFSAFSVLITDNKFAEALDYYVENMGLPSYQSEHHFLMSSVVIRRCPVCGVNHLSFVMAKQKGNDWSDISETQIRRFTEEQLNIP